MFREFWKKYKLLIIALVGFFFGALACQVGCDDDFDDVPVPAVEDGR